MSNASVGRSFDEMVQARVGRESAFAEALLQWPCSRGNLNVARSLIRDVIKGSIGYAIEPRTGTPQKSLPFAFPLPSRAWEGE